MFFAVKTPRFLCIGKMYSSKSSADVTPTEIASCPIPENHLEILPCLKRIIIFSSTNLGFIIDLYKSTNSLSEMDFLLNCIFHFNLVPKLLNIFFTLLKI